MLRRTYEVALAAECGPVMVLTDSEEVLAEVESFGGDARMTDPDLPSGTARIASVVDDLTTDVVINLQGDAPLADPEVIARSAREAAQTGAPVTIAVYRITRPGDVHDDAVTKILRGHDGRVLYCSRSPVPHVREVAPEDWASTVNFWAPVGLYAYQRDFLRTFPALPESELARVERLEQLQWLEAGVRIHSFESDPMPGPSVNTLDQLERVREIFAQGGLR